MSIPLGPRAFADIITFSRASAAWYFGDDGVLRKEPTNDLPRFDHDPADNSARGFLLEPEARTNLFTRSEELDHADWTKTNATISADATGAPDGTTTADKIVEDSSDAPHDVRQSKNVTSGSKYTISAFVEPAGRTVVRLSFASAGFTTASAWFDISAGTVGTTEAEIDDAKIEDVGGGRFRVQATSTADATDSGTVLLALADADNSSSYQGDGSSGIYAWGLQLEEGPDASSYIQTTSAQVTRAAETAKIEDMDPWYVQDGYSVVAEWEPRGVIDDDPDIVFDINDGSSDDRVELRTDQNTALVVRVGGTLVASIQDVGSVSEGSATRASIRVSSGDFAISADGGAAQTDTSGDAPGSATQVTIGSRNNQVRSFNGWLRHFEYRPKALTNAELEAESAQ